MARGVIHHRLVSGLRRIPILALVAGMGFFVPVVAGAPGAAVPEDAFRADGDAPASLAGATALVGTGVEAVSTRGGSSRGGSLRRAPTALSRLYLPLAVLRLAGHEPYGTAAARLARAGRLSAPATAPPLVRS